MIMKRLTAFAVALVGLLAACSTSPEQPDPLTASPTSLNSFGANPSSPPVNIPVEFSWSVAGTNLTCSLDADNNGTTDYTVQNCSSGNRIYHLYPAVGSFVARLTVIGSDGLSREQTTPVTVLAQNTSPQILSFKVSQGNQNNLIIFSWMVSDNQADTLRCRLDANGDGTWELDQFCGSNSAQVGSLSTSNNQIEISLPNGSYTAALEVYDSYTVTRSTQSIRSPYNRLPVIQSFRATAGSNLQGKVNFQVSDPDGDPVTCLLTVQSIGRFTYGNCASLARTYTFPSSGSYRVTLEVTDTYNGVSTQSGAVVFGGTPPIPMSSRIGGGENHTCMLRSTDEAYCWGDNNYGQLGNATNSGVDIAVPDPQPVQGGLQFTQLTTGQRHTCGLTSTGQAYCWGSNSDGALGNSSNVNSGNDNPNPLPVDGGITFTYLSAGRMTCGVSSAGSAYCWGTNEYGELGNATNAGAGDPNPSPLLVEGNHIFTAVSTGSYHACGLTTAGQAHCWGTNEYGQLGNATNAGNEDPNYSPLLVGNGLAFTSLSVGKNHTCGLTSAGTAYCWGYNYYGQLGNTTNVLTSDPNPDPLPVDGGHTFSRIAVGSFATCGLTSTGQVYCWGSNNAGQLGNNTNSGSYNSNPSPFPVDGNHTFIHLGAGYDHFCGITSASEVYCWGMNNKGQVDSPTTGNNPNPDPRLVEGITY